MTSVPSPLKTAEHSYLTALAGRQNFIVLFVLAIIFSIGFLGVMGVTFHKPNLYIWHESIAITLYEAQALMMLPIAVVALMGSEILWRKRLVWFARLIFLGIMSFGLAELSSYARVPAGLTVEQFLVPLSPVQGHIPIYAAMGLSMVGLASFLFSLRPKKESLLQGAVQGLGIFLMSLGLSGLFEHMGNHLMFHFFSSIPMSVGLLLYGVVLLLLPMEKPLLGSSFFGTPAIQRYAWALLLFWGVSIAWQSIWNNVYLLPGHLDSNPLYFKVAMNEVVEILLSAMILMLGLHILSSLSDRERMAQSLQESSEKLRASLDSVALLASTLSHDLKAPIITQMKAVEMLSSGRYGDQISNPANQEMLSAILDNNQFELDLVLNLINLLRYKIQDQQFHPKEIKLQPFLAEIQKELAPLAIRKDQELILYSNIPDEQTLMADPLGLKRVLHNLINNAILHLSEGHHIRVDVRLQSEEFIFSVRDDGPGIPLEKQSSLFNQFNRMSSSGLGLYIAKQIVERHGGKIWVESQPKQGASFYFSLPEKSINPVKATDSDAQSADAARTGGIAG